MKSKLKIFTLVLLVFLLFANFSHAEGLVNCAGGANNCQISDLILTIIHLINYLYGLAGLIAMGFIVWAGWGLMNAGGNEEKITGSKEILSNAIIGFFLVLVSFVLINAIVGLLGGFTLEQLFNFIK